MSAYLDTYGGHEHKGTRTHARTHTRTHPNKQTDRQTDRQTDTHHLAMMSTQQRGPGDRVTKGSRIAQTSRGGADFRLPVARCMWFLQGFRFAVIVLGATAA